MLTIQEYARHNGHADLLRERTDGRRATENGPAITGFYYGECEMRRHAEVARCLLKGSWLLSGYGLSALCATGLRRHRRLHPVHGTLGEAQGLPLNSRVGRSLSATES